MKHAVSIVVSVVTAVAWIAMCAWTLLVLLVFWKVESAQVGAVQEASLAAIAAAHLIAGYALARAVDALGRKIVDVVSSATELSK